jgi:hypothetical protein
MQADETVSDRIEARKLRWFGHVMRMPEERWPEGRGDDQVGHSGTASQRQ